MVGQGAPGPPAFGLRAGAARARSAPLEERSVYLSAPGGPVPGRRRGPAGAPASGAGRLVAGLPLPSEPGESGQPWPALGLGAGRLGPPSLTVCPPVGPPRRCRPGAAEPRGAPRGSGIDRTGEGLSVVGAKYRAENRPRGRSGWAGLAGGRGTVHRPGQAGPPCGLAQSLFLPRGSLPS